MTRPRLLFLRGRSGGLPGYVRTHLDEQVRCLERWFEVVVAEGSLDYAEVCERVEPDACLLESGVYAHGRALTRTDAHPGVPKLGFLHADAYCASRSAALADFALWGVHDLVTTSAVMAEYTPAIADRLFVWANFVDPELHHDRGLPKELPVLLTGSHGTHYPWRVGVAREVSRSGLPSRRTPHLGWFDPRAEGGMVTGVEYARLLGSAWMVPACGTIARDLVRKQLEAPACGSLLVAEPSAALAAAGFRDGDNCVLADPVAAVARMEELLRKPAELRRLIAGGHALVHERHTMGARSQVHDWYLLRRGGSSAPLTQADPFARVRAGAGEAPRVPAGVPARDRVLLAASREELEAGRVPQATRLARRALRFHPALEPLAALARCHLRGGDPLAAAERAVQGVRHSTEVLGADPDPVLWALVLRAELACGRPRRAQRLAGQYPLMHHPELDRTRAVVALLNGAPPPPVADGPARPSVVPTVPADDHGWLAELVDDLRACGRHRLAAHVVRRTRPAAARLRRTVPAGARAPRLRPWTRLARRHWATPLRSALVRAAGERGRDVAELVRTTQPSSVVIVGGRRAHPLRAAAVRAAEASPHVADLRWLRSGEDAAWSGVGADSLVVVLDPRLLPAPRRDAAVRSAQLAGTR